MRHIISDNGSEYWYDENDNYHRIDDGPVVIHTEGSEVWYINGFLHRNNNPAYIIVNGKENWYNNEKQIR